LAKGFSLTLYTLNQLIFVRKESILTMFRNLVFFWELLYVKLLILRSLPVDHKIIFERPPFV
jgi:hypothetical protein